MANVDITSVGIDLITKRVSKATAKKEKRNLSNLFFYKAEAVEFISLIPDSIKIQNTFVMFPDPWPKHKHHKRRLIQHDFLSPCFIPKQRAPAKFTLELIMNLILIGQ